MNKSISRLFRRLEHFFFSVFFIHVAAHVVCYGVFGEHHGFIESVLSFWRYVKTFYLPVAAIILFLHLLFSKITPSQLYSYYLVNLRKAKEFLSSPVSFIKREIKISDFLKEIGQSGGDFSGILIDKIFVPPDEFEKTKEKLKDNKIVFITGTTGYGKTYTAIRLLWERYNEGYVPRWIAGKEQEDRKLERELLANIDAVLKPNHIIYFEDPFGKTKYERRDDLKERINFIIDAVKNKENVYVILTSRKDVFEEFERESYSVEEIKEFEEELNILKPSYSYEKRKQILEKWAEEKECVWMEDEELKKTVFESLEDKERLPTPLSIHDFAEATVKVKEERVLRQKIGVYSGAVEKAFADEIKGLCDYGRKDRVLFLSLLFVSQHLEVDFVKRVYEKLKQEGSESFERILKEEYRVKVGESLLDRKRTLGFSHPLYSNAIPYILDHAGCKNIFSEVLKELSQYDAVVGHVAWAVVENFDKLPEDARNLLFKLAEKDEAAEAVARAIAYSQMIPKDGENKFLLKIPEDVGNKFLLKLAEEGKAIWYVVWAIVENFDKLPEDVRSLLFKLAERDEAVWSLALAVAKNFDKLPEDVRGLLFKLAERAECVWAITWAVTKNFDKLPEDVRNKLSFKPSEKDAFALVVAQAVLRSFEKLPEDVRNLLLKFVEKDETVEVAVARDFKKLPQPQIAAIVAVRNFEKFPEDVRGMLFKLAEEDEFAEYVGRAVAENFGKLPEVLRNKLLIQLS